MADIREWDPVAINNSQPSPDGYPEQMLPSGVNDSDRETMAAIRRKWQDADWFDWGHAITYVSPFQFSIPGDVTSIYHIDRRVRAVMPVAGTIYGRISASEFVTNTTVTVIWDSASLQLESGIQVSVGVQIANAVSTSLPMYWIQNTFGLLNPDILCYQDKNSVDIQGGVIAGGQVNKEVLLESFPNVQNQVANPTHEELNTLVGVTTGQSIQAQLDALDTAVKALTPLATIRIHASLDLTDLNAFGEWRVCDGSSLSTTTYAALFALLEYRFGGSGGSFNLPDLRGRVPVGHDANATGRMTGYRQGMDAGSLGNVGGEQSHTPVEDEMFQHGHGYQLWSGAGNGDEAQTSNKASGPVQGDTFLKGNSADFNVTQPGQIVNYVIRVA